MSCIVAVAYGAVASWSTLFSHTLESDSAGWGGTSIREVFDTSILSLNGTHVRVTVQASIISGCTIDSMYIGEAAASGDPYDFDGGQKQLLFSSSGSVTLGTNASIVTDELAFSVDHTKNLVIAAHFSGTSSVKSSSTSATGCSRYQKTGSDESSVSDVSGYSLVSNKISFIGKIEVR